LNLVLHLFFPSALLSNYEAEGVSATLAQRVERQQTLKNRLDVVFLQLFPIEIIEGAVVGKKPL
jgi:hypothetical protein